MITRAVIANYKSIAFCDVKLGSLNFLVGLNGSGKSNFMDALFFCKDALSGSVQKAFHPRSTTLEGLSYRRSEPGFGFRLELRLPSGAPALYSFWIGSNSSGRIAVQREKCEVDSRAHFTVENGQVVESSKPLPSVSEDRSLLVAASSYPEFREIYDVLTQMQIYSPDPLLTKGDVPYPDAGELLDGSGQNAARVLERIAAEDPAAKQRIVEYMARILPGLIDITVEPFKDHRYLNFRQRVLGDRTVEFGPNDMSDGTLRALVILIALFQNPSAGKGPSLIAIDEPETGLHPAAAGVLLESLAEGASRTQVIVSTHSPDLLDNPRLRVESFLTVEYVDGQSRVSSLGAITRSVLKDRLYTAGELLRMDQLRADHASLATPAKDLLFDGEPSWQSPLS